MILGNLGKAKFFTTLDLKSSQTKYTWLKNTEKKHRSQLMDDVLREEIGKMCYVYVDYVIIFSESETEHVKHIGVVLKGLLDANMRVEDEIL